ncbi:enoyl-CoA hydratase [Mycolicibacterium conceptionense]|uniref:Enoyl-CoA hydratase n=1 Tax=Mycolicibacterium conceptionense TaxID=451644 RepID=A0A0U1DK22_9MYCO|nr:enoyl-CoA hydratase [Mycolicibacterium conceptionense]
MTVTREYPDVKDVSVTLEGGVLSVTLNRPDSLNSLTQGMLVAIADAMDLAASDPEVRVVRLGGAGRGFSSGAGISEEDQNADSHDAEGVLDAANRAVASIVALPKPVVAVVQGPAAGVGVSLALLRRRAGVRPAFFLLAFTKIGLMPDGGARRSSRDIGRIRAMRLALLADRLTAADATTGA